MDIENIKDKQVNELKYSRSSLDFETLKIFLTGISHQVLQTRLSSHY